MSYRGMISDADLIGIMFDLSLHNATDLAARRGVVNMWDAQGNNSIDRREDSFWAAFEESLGKGLDAAVELERQRQYAAQVKVAEQVVLGSVAQDVKGYLLGIGTRTSVRYSPIVEQTEDGIQITVNVKGTFGSAGRKNATDRDVSAMTRNISLGQISFDHTPTLAIDRYEVAIRPLEGIQLPSSRGHTHSFQIAYRALVPTGMLGTIYATHPKQ